MELNGTWKLADFDPGTGERQGAEAWEFDDQAWLDAIGLATAQVVNELLASYRAKDRLALGQKGGAPA